MTVQFYKKPKQSRELQMFHYLHPRWKLSASSLRTYENLQKGYLGEKKFYQNLKRLLSSHCIVLFDLLLESNGTTFQIDCLLIFQNTIYLLEIKNYEGDFYLHEGKWYSLATRKEIRSTLHQLDRSEFLLRQILQRHGYHFSVKPYVVFVNESFTLYEASLQMPVVFPTQLHRFIEKFNRSPSNLTAQHEKLASQLVKNTIDESVFQQLPEYEFRGLKKGITCNRCHSFMEMVGNKKVNCNNCGDEEGVDSAVIRSAVEYSLLFPE